MTRFGEDQPAGHADDPRGLAEDELDGARVFVPGFGPLDGELAGLHIVEGDHAAFGLGDDFLGDDEHIAAFERGVLGAQGGVDQLSEIVALSDFGDAADGEDAVFGRRGAHSSMPTTCTAACAL